MASPGDASMQRTRTLLAVALAAAAACGAFAMLLLGQSETASPKRGAADEASHDWSDRGESNAPNRRTKSRRRVDPANASKPRALGDGWYVGDGHEHVVSFDDAPNVNDDPRFRPIGSWTGTDLELHKAMRECFTTSDHMAAPCDFAQRGDGPRLQGLSRRRHRGRAAGSTPKPAGGLRGRDE